MSIRKPATLFCLILAFSISSFGKDGDAPAKPNPKWSKTVRATKEFFNCWLVRRDAECFWNFMASSSSTLQANAFEDVFDAHDEKKIPEIHVGYIEDDLKEAGIACLNKTADDSFCVVDGNQATLLFDYLYDKKVALPEPAYPQMLFAVYIIESDGYNKKGAVIKKGMVLAWVEEMGKWKIQKMFEFK